MRNNKSFYLIALSLVLLASGCSTWSLKKRCENTNWFDYSRDLANRGGYLEEDDFIKQCKGVGKISDQQLDLGFKSGRERYCTYESFMRNGEAGEPVNFKMCDGLIMYQMQERYAQGLKKFCVPDVGYTYGASGHVYKNVCLKDDEKKFLPRYFVGRREYLTKLIAQLGEKNVMLSATQATLGQQIQVVTSEVNSLPSPQQCRTVTVYNEYTKANENRNVCEEADYIRARRSTLNSQLDSLRGQYSQQARDLQSVQKDLNEAKGEMTKIPNAI